MKSSSRWLMVLVVVTTPLSGFFNEVNAQIADTSATATALSKQVQRRKTSQNRKLLLTTQQAISKQTSIKQNKNTLLKRNDSTLLSVEGVLEDGDLQLSDSSLYDIHLFEGQSTQVVRIELTSSDFDTFLILQNASGEELVRNDDGSDDTNSEIVFRLPAIGQYRILTNAYDENSKGSYQLTVSTVDENELLQTELKYEATQLLQRGIEAFQREQFLLAIDTFQQALTMYRQIDAPSIEGSLLSVLADAYEATGDYSRAITAYQDALIIERELENRYRETDVLIGLGFTHFQLGDAQKAIEYHQEALAIARELSDRQREGNAHGNLGIAYDRLGDYQSAINSHSLQLEIARDIGDLEAESTALGNLGLVYFSIGDYPRTIDLHQQSLSISQATSNRRGEALSLGNLGLAFYEIEDYQQAAEFHNQSLERSRAIGDRRQVASSLNSLGNTYRAIDNQEKAIDFYHQALSIHREIGSRTGAASTLNNLGGAYQEIEDSQQAIKLYQQSLALFQEANDPVGVSTALNNIGVAYLQLEKNPVVAAEILYEAVSVLENLRSDELEDRDLIKIFDTQISTYRWLELSLITQDKYEEALEVAERGRTQSFMRLLSEKSMLEDKRLIQSPDFRKIQKVAAEHQSTIVEYSFSGSTSGNGYSLYIWLVQPTGKLHFKEVPLENRSAIAELVRQSREQMNVPGRGGFNRIHSNRNETNVDKLHQLYQLLIEPIAEFLPDSPEARVAFIPQGELFLVPFSALRSGSGKYLIEQHTILTAPSIQVLDLTRRQSSINDSFASTELLAVGNPLMPTIWDPQTEESYQLSSLVGAEREALAIATLFDTEALVGTYATERAVKQQISSARIVHLATHGLLEFGVPESSGVRDIPGAIALASTENEDGLLTSTEILELNLKAELIVLSACDTGLGMVTGDGVVGLSRSLIAAG